MKAAEAASATIMANGYGEAPSCSAVASATGAISTAVAVLEMNRPISAVSRNRQANSACGPASPSRPTSPGGEGDAAGLLQREGERQHADDQHQALPVDRLVGAVHVDAAEQAHDQTADQRRQHVGHQAADHQCDHQRQAEQGEWRLVGRRRHVVHLRRQA